MSIRERFPLSISIVENVMDLRFEDFQYNILHYEYLGYREREYATQEILSRQPFDQNIGFKRIFLQGQVSLHKNNNSSLPIFKTFFFSSGLLSFLRKHKELNAKTHGFLNFRCRKKELDLFRNIFKNLLTEKAAV